MKKIVNFKFEQLELSAKNPTFLDFYGAPRDTTTNFLMQVQQGFRFSQVVDGLMYYWYHNQDDSETCVFSHVSQTDDGPYIIPAAVLYNPLDWTDSDTNGDTVANKLSFFELLNPTYLKDLQTGKALLLIDQSVEGYSIKWLWSWFHEKCQKYYISPSSIIYCTGDQSSKDRYDEWLLENPQVSKLKIIPSISLTTYLHKHYLRFNIKTNFDDLLKHKTENSSNIYLFDCINKRPRPQRILNFLHLLNAGLLEKGNISMPAQADWITWFNSDRMNFTEHSLPQDIMNKLLPNHTPREAKHSFDSSNLTHFYHYVERILDDMYKNSWVSLVVESSYFDREYSVFLSEKTFKPIACMQPFIICGSKHSLKYLRKLGFKTFHPYIDESYDETDDKERWLGIIDAIKKIESIEDKESWYSNMRDILKHNHKLFIEIGKKRSLEHKEICKYYFEFVDKYHVSNTL